MSLIKPNRDTLFDLLEHCMESVYLTVALCDSTKLNALMPKALEKAQEWVDKFYNLCRYDYPELLSTCYTNIHCVENSDDVDYLSAAFECLANLYDKLVEEDNDNETTLVHEEFCDACKKVVSLYNVYLFYQKLVDTSQNKDFFFSMDQAGQLVSMLKTMDRERLLPESLNPLYQSFLNKEADCNKAKAELEEYLLKEINELNNGGAKRDYDLMIFLLTLLEIKGISALSFDKESELFHIHFADGWDREAIGLLSDIEEIEFHQQADSNDIIVDAWKRAPQMTVYEVNLDLDTGKVDVMNAQEGEFEIIEKLIDMLSAAKESREKLDDIKGPQNSGNEELNHLIKEAMAPLEIEECELDQRLNLLQREYERMDNLAREVTKPVKIVDNKEEQITYIPLLQAKDLTIKPLDKEKKKYVYNNEGQLLYVETDTGRHMTAQGEKEIMGLEEGWEKVFEDAFGKEDMNETEKEPLTFEEYSDFKGCVEQIFEVNDESTSEGRKYSLKFDDSDITISYTYKEPKALFDMLDAIHRGIEGYYIDAHLAILNDDQVEILNQLDAVQSKKGCHGAPMVIDEVDYLAYKDGFEQCQDEKNSLVQLNNCLKKELAESAERLKEEKEENEEFRLTVSHLEQIIEDQKKALEALAIDGNEGFESSKNKDDVKSNEGPCEINYPANFSSLQDELYQTKLDLAKKNSEIKSLKKKLKKAKRKAKGLKRAIEDYVELEGLIEKEMDSQSDPIHPDYYKDGDMECIDVMYAYLGSLGMEHFCKGTAFKYLWRAGNKQGNTYEQDRAKARWYLEKMKEYEL